MIKKVDLNVIKIDKSFIPMETEYPGKETDIDVYKRQAYGGATKLSAEDGFLQFMIERLLASLSLIHI